jgi:hypothetical protein
VVVLLALPCLNRAAPTLTFDERVAAQEAITRLYHSHLIGARQPFEEAVPSEIIEGKVRTYLAQSVALEELWATPVTAAMLQRELERIARGTRLPDRLAEIYDALGRDSIVLQECLARPVLVDRLTRRFFAHDPRIHAAAWRRAEDLRRRLRDGVLDPATETPGRSAVELARGNPDEPPGPGQGHVLSTEDYDRRRAAVPARVGEVGPALEERDRLTVSVLLDEAPDRVRMAVYTVPKKPWKEWWESISRQMPDRDVTAASPIPVPAPWRTAASFEAGEAAAGCVPDDTWDNGILDDGETSGIVVWTGSEVIVWGSSSGSRYDPLTDSWRYISDVGTPAPRTEPTAVWTGSEMIIWGGGDPSTGDGFVAGGGHYDPLQDAWTPIGIAGAPTLRKEHVAVWTGSEMLVWGGETPTGSGRTGNAYDPETGEWGPLSGTNAPPLAYEAVGFWTGDRMLVWGGIGEGGSYPVTGGLYDPITDSWTPTSTVGAIALPWGRAVWAGDRMIVLHGEEGMSYHPGTDAWTPITAPPRPRTYHAAVWAGDRMIVFGGYWYGYLGTADSYDPVVDSWTALSDLNAPSPRSRALAVWTGSLMVVWGGRGHPDERLTPGGRYDPSTDVWTPMAPGDAPEGRSRHTAVWTGTEMIVWGGKINSSTYSLVTNTGGRYDPLTDSWSPTTTTDAPQARWRHTAVWSGQEMLAWGGQREGQTSASLYTGGRYDPLADAWSPTETVGVPSSRMDHVAVWTGEQMVVWGGWNNVGSHTQTGGRYDPATGTWQPTALAGSPNGRHSFSAVWTGDEMIVWGGKKTSPTDTGGRYNPVDNVWQSTSLTGAPSARADHVAVWTGDRMIVWGGTDDSTGGRYDPQADTWIPTSLVDAPAPRYHHSAVWTGTEMIVWGGDQLVYPTGTTNTGARYDPAGDLWRSVSSVDAPGPREYHSAVWTGSHMIVWGGSLSRYGGRYHAGGPYDLDRDGYDCDIDCDDGDAGTYPGAPEVCDGRDNDCDEVLPPDEVDADGDTVPQCNDCDDSQPHCAADCTDEDLDGFCVTDDCDDGNPDCTSDCTDADVDGFCVTTDCDDGNATAYPGAPELCDGADNDCDSVVPPDEVDADLDGFYQCEECDDTNPDSFPGNPEVCDGVDNNCDGAVDESFDIDLDLVADCLDNCPMTPNPDQNDQDSDGAGNLCDCAPADGSAYAAPGEVEAVTVLPDAETVSWTSAVPSTGPGTVHDVVRGSLGQWPVGSGPSESCLASGLAADWVSDPGGLTPGEGAWYLVRASNVCAVGTYGAGASGGERVTSACP